MPNAPVIGYADCARLLAELWRRSVELSSTYEMIDVRGGSGALSAQNRNVQKSRASESCPFIDAGRREPATGRRTARMGLSRQPCEFDGAS